MINKTDTTNNGSHMVVVPFELIDYLSNDNAYRNPKRYSKLEAFRDLIMRYRNAIGSGEKMSANIAQLSKTWNWSRTTVCGFVNDLAVLDVLEVNVTPTSKVISLKASVLGNQII